MKKGIVWLVLSCLMVVSLVLAACAPKVTEEKPAVTEAQKQVAAEEKKEVAAETGAVAEKAGMVRDALGKLVKAPQYGGTLTLVESSDPAYGFRNSSLLRARSMNSKWNITPSNEVLLNTDRLKGPAGTGEWEAVAGTLSYYSLPHIVAGNLAERWEIIQPDTIIFHIRKGIHWQDKPPVKGMELTAEDVVYSFVLHWGREGNAWRTSYRYISNLENPEKSIYLDPDDPWAVVLKSAPGMLGPLWGEVANKIYIVPKALGSIEGEGFVDWRGVVGTGPFLLTDYVSGSSLTWKRNPNYWKKDPLHPQNQLPYLDDFRVLIVPDFSTQIAALRTGKVDILKPVQVDDAKGLMSTNPELLFKKGWDVYAAIFMRNDRKPFDDVRVRRAMQMAINLDEIVKEYYDGEAEKFWDPVPPIAEYSLMYVPLEKMPQSVKELYTYNPDKAKQLLAEAGYSKGFKTSVNVSGANEDDIDLLAVIKAYWAKVGVDLEIQVKEPTVYAAMNTAFTYEHGTFSSVPGSEPLDWQRHSAVSGSNYARMNEPLVEAIIEAARAAYSRFDWPELSRIIREGAPELINLANFVKLPASYAYTLWQPWVGSYYGEMQVGYQRPIENVSEYVWIDEGLKKAMGR